MPFLPVDQKQSFPKLEEEILQFWKDHQTFEKSVNARSKDNEYVFYDGPPFATGLPHYGHILAGTMKDVVPRYWTMRGKRVERVFGWDCHGLPVENLIEKEKGITNKKQIDEMGVKAFNEACRQSVFKYTKEWEKTVERMGRWVDFKNGYRTMDVNFMESVWWVFKQLWEKKLVYKGNKNMLICPHCATPLSNFESTLNYKDIDDHAITVKMFLTKESAQKLHPDTGKPIAIVPWTTTPWTLPGNMAVMVGSDIQYVLIEEEKECYILAEKAVSRYYGKDTPNIVKRFAGKELFELEYEPLFPYHPKKEYRKKYPNVFRILTADIVSEDEGTGVVHSAVTYGDEDDFDIALTYNLPFVKHVLMDGTMAPYIKEFAGMYWKDAEDAIAKSLKDRGLTVKYEQYRHSYPHCWRCETPLMYFTMEAWYVNVQDLKERLMHHADSLHWQPEHLKDGRFGKWLENARDWNITRNRYWGSTIPVWECDQEKCTVQIAVGSRAELKELSGVMVDDLHKEVVDEVMWNCTCGKGMMRRIPEVFDCWFESGSMPYGQRHYPFENKEWFTNNFPADFIAEGVDQCRLWFYVLHVLATALFDKPAYKNVVANGIVLAEDGQKMSKSKKNYPDPQHIFETYGADAMRFYLMTSPVVRAADLRFSEKGVELVVKNVLLPIWNAYSFFITYANIDHWTPGKQPKSLDNKLDRWVLSELHSLIKRVTADMDDYNLQAIRHIHTFIDNLTNWYIRRSRRRFWRSGSDTDKDQAYYTLYTVLSTLCQVAAPVMPFISESMYRNLTGQESVHLSDWPSFDESLIDEELNVEIALTHTIANLGHAARSRAKLKVRLPLSKVQIGLPEKYRDLLHDDQIEVLREELNVKEVQIVADPEHIGKCIVKPNAKLLGPKLGAKVQDVIREAKAGNFERTPDGMIHVLGYDLTPEEVEIAYIGKPGFDVECDGGIIVALDIEITEELKLEGLAREIIRHIQELRKKADYSITDRISVSVVSDAAEIQRALEQYKELISSEVLATSLEIKNLINPDHTATLEIEEHAVTICIRR